MIWGSPDQRKAQGHVHGRFECHQLQGDQPLVVVQGDDTIKLVVKSLAKNRICRERARDRLRAILLVQCVNSRLENGFLLITKGTFLRSVRVQATKSQSRLRNVDAAEGFNKNPRLADDFIVVKG